MHFTVSVNKNHFQSKFMKDESINERDLSKCVDGEMEDLDDADK
jgi:hypothetical protein